MLDKIGGRRRKLTKDERMAVYKKANGHCAYCGCELEYKDMRLTMLSLSMVGQSKERIRWTICFPPVGAATTTKADPL